MTGGSATRPFRLGTVGRGQAGGGSAAPEWYSPGGFQTEPFAIADELTCYYDRPAEPANVHLEVRVPGKLDESDLRAAVHAVLEAEPGITVRQAPGTSLRSGFQWEIRGTTDVDPVLTASYEDEAELAGLRSAMLSQSPPLRTSPPFRFLLASGPDGDALILNAHHARFDGLSCLRLVRAVADQYCLLAGSGCPSTASRGVTGSPSAVPGKATPRSAFPGDYPRSPRPPTARPGRIAKIARQPEPGPPAARLGYGVHHVAWHGLAAANRLKSSEVSVNDVLITAMMLTISGWNQAHGTRSGLIAITMPVGDRVQTGAGGRWANTSRLTTVTARLRRGPRDLERAALLADVATQTRYAKDHPGAPVDLFSRALTAAPIPVAVKLRLLRAALAIAGPFLCDSSLVSNLGVIEPLAFGAAVADQLWFSTFAHMPRGLSLGTATVAGRLHLTFRYRRALLTDAAAAAFALRYCQALDVLTGSGAALTGSEAGS